MGHAAPLLSTLCFCLLGNCVTHQHIKCVFAFSHFTNACIALSVIKFAVCAADSFHNAGPHGDGSHVMHAHHDVPYSVSYTETMQQPLSPMVVGPNMDQQQKDHNQMAQHLNLHGENVVHG